MTAPDKTPFDHWWKLYPGFRKNNKPKCKEKFNAHDLGIQRKIYTHTKDCITNHPDWQTKEYICAPEVYLNQHRWESEPPPSLQAGGRPVTIESGESPAQKLHGLEMLAKASGNKDPLIQGQIDQLKLHLGARDI